MRCSVSSVPSAEMIISVGRAGPLVIMIGSLSVGGAWAEPNSASAAKHDHRS